MSRDEEELAVRADDNALGKTEVDVFDDKGFNNEVGMRCSLGRGSFRKQGKR